MEADNGSGMAGSMNQCSELISTKISDGSKFDKAE